ncbi:MAG: hypothetical protein SangKO_004670 [Sandaracinaceae bacterium]
MRLVVLLSGLAVALPGCADRCADLPDTPSLSIGGAPVDGDRFEPFADGADRALVPGTQGGMHVWLHARIRGICPDTARLDRRVTDADGALVQLGRGPVAWVDADEGFELAAPQAMVLCPSIDGRVVVDRPHTFEVSVEDEAGRRAEATLGFVAMCEDPTVCDAFCR